MTLTDKQTAALTLKMLACTTNLDTAKECAIAALQELADRDAEWIKFVKDQYNVDVDPGVRNRLNALYAEAQNTIKKF